MIDKLSSNRAQLVAQTELRSDLVDVGPRYALFFYLLHDTPVYAYMHGLPVSHGWFIGAEHRRVSALLRERNPVRE